MKTTNLNTPITVTAFAFGRGLHVSPTRMEWNGRTYHFIDRGLRTIVRSGDLVAQILTMSDGMHSFRLKCDSKSHSWTLLSVS